MSDKLRGFQLEILHSIRAAHRDIEMEQYHLAKNRLASLDLQIMKLLISEGEYIPPRDRTSLAAPARPLTNKELERENLIDSYRAEYTRVNGMPPKSIRYENQGFRVEVAFGQCSVFTLSEFRQAIATLGNRPAWDRRE